MPTIVFPQSKGGAGKTTAAITLACEIARNGASVTIIDADPNQHSAKWAKKDGCPNNISIIENPPARGIDEHIIDDIETAKTKTSFVIVDLEGTANMAVGYAISRADTVIVCVQGSQDDADEAVRTISLIKQQEKAFQKKIDYSILITRAPAALNPKLLRGIVNQFKEAGVPVLTNRLVEREAFKAIKSYGGSLYDLSDSEVSGASKACKDAAMFTAEVIEIVKNKVI